MEEMIWELFFEKCREGSSMVKTVRGDHSSKWADMTKGQEALVQGLWLGVGRAGKEKKSGRYIGK